MALDILRTRPYTFGGSLSQVMDRLFEQAIEPYSNGGSGRPDGSFTGYQSIPVNVWETGEGYQAALMAPGLDESSINVTVHDDTLVIEGELRVQVPEGAKAVWQEFGPSKFRRSLRLGSAVDAARVEALYRQGLLLVTMPKAEHAKPRQIQVQVASAEPATAKK